MPYMSMRSPSGTFEVAISTKNPATLAHWLAEWAFEFEAEMRQTGFPIQVYARPLPHEPRRMAQTGIREVTLEAITDALKELF